MFLYLFLGFKKMELTEHNRKVNAYPSCGESLCFYVNAFFALHIRIYKLMLECVRF